ncbi:hypothetical protein ACFYTQ_31090 [Nocardia sp. NPDC004068]|uniref:hypothetical protein n=1 Tax=Nocardia sp. NPDC004068 TaxID=3364303 RepID=UPI0036942685
MTDTDPHIHVDRKVVAAGADVRNAMVSVLGFAPDTPGAVTTGCGVRAAFSMTSARPEKVTCLPCREFAAAAYRRLADQVERAARMPGVNITATDAATAATRLREIAARFAG